MAYSYSDVAHAWAHNLNKQYRSASVYRTEDGCIKSYNTCIGQRLEVNGNVIFVVNRARYSNSTSKHQSAVWGAIPDNYPVFECNFANWDNSDIVSPNYYSEGFSQTELIRFGMRMLIEGFEECTGMKTKNKRMTWKAYNQLSDWCRLTGCTTIPKLIRMSNKEFKRHMPGCINYWMYGPSQRCEVLPAELKLFLKMMYEKRSIEEICDAINGVGTFAKFQKRQEAIEKAKRTRALHKDLNEIKQREARTYVEKVIMERGDEGRVFLWHSGYNVRIPHLFSPLLHGGNVLMRVKGKYVETSKGIKVPCDECKRLWAIISRWHDKGVEFQRGETVHSTLTTFTISEFYNDVMIAGSTQSHTTKWLMSQNN